MLIGKKLGSGTPNRNTMMKIWMDENVQYLVMAVFFLVTTAHVTALLPYAVFSLFHSLTYLTTNVLPTFTPGAASSGLTPRIQEFCKTNYEPAMQIVSRIEVLLTTPIMLMSILTFSISGLTKAALWLYFLRYRYFSSGYTRQTFTHLTLRIDHLVANPNIPPLVRSIWTAIKTNVRRYGATPLATSAHGSNGTPEGAKPASKTT